jgi:hypothetical protein
MDQDNSNKNNNSSNGDGVNAEKSCNMNYDEIYNKISKNLFFFLRDKVSPIKFLDERPNGEIWFRKRNSEGILSIEVEIKPVPLAAHLHAGTLLNEGAPGPRSSSAFVAIAVAA